MYYTRAGDTGTTTVYGCNQRLSKSSAIAEALGALDEATSFLGLLRARTEKVLMPLERHIDALARVIPPITTFIVPGGSESSALADMARTIVRRAERRVVAVVEEGIVIPAPATLAYLNRLSSFLFILARYVNKEAGVDEHAPAYDSV